MFRVGHLLPIAPDLVERIERAALAGEDVLGALAPDEGLRLGVVLQELCVNLGDEVWEGSVSWRMMVFKLIQAAAKTWRRLKGANQLPLVIEGVTITDGVAQSAVENRAA